MKKDEFAVGEVFQFGLKKLKVIDASDASHGCIGCELYNLDVNDCLSLVGCCSEQGRSDGTDVQFREVREDEE